MAGTGLEIYLGNPPLDLCRGWCLRGGGSRLFILGAAPIYRDDAWWKLLLPGQRAGSGGDGPAFGMVANVPLVGPLPSSTLLVLTEEAIAREESFPRFLLALTRDVSREELVLLPPDPVAAPFPALRALGHYFTWHLAARDGIRQGNLVAKCFVAAWKADPAFRELCRRMGAFLEGESGPALPADARARLGRALIYPDEGPCHRLAGRLTSVWRQEGIATRLLPFPVPAGEEGEAYEAIRHYLRLEMFASRVSEIFILPPKRWAGMPDGLRSRLSLQSLAVAGQVA